MSTPMPSEAKATAEAVVRLPRALRSRADRSAYSLLEQSGYLDRHADVTPGLLRASLASDPQLVDEWLAFSEDKRTSSGWYFRLGPTGFAVGLVGPEGSKLAEETYADRIVACATFIKREVEEMRRLG